MSEPRVVQQMRQHVAEHAMMARTAGHADPIYLPDVLEVIDTLTQRAEAAEAERESVSSQLWDCMNEREALRAERDALRKDAMGVVNVLGFFASCIKSGEPWTPQCEDMLRAAFAHRAALAVPPTTSTEIHA